MIPQAYGIRSIGAVDDGTCAGNAAHQVLANTAPPRRSGLMVKNHDASLNLWVKLVPRGTSSVTLSSTSNNYVVGPNATLLIGASESVDVYVQNSAGDATTSRYTATNYSY